MQLNAIIYQWLYMHFKYMYFMLNVFNTNIWAVNERVTFSMLHTKTSGFTESWRRLDMNFINSCTKCLLIQWFNIWLHILKYFVPSIIRHLLFMILQILNRIWKRNAHAPKIFVLVCLWRYTKRSRFYFHWRCLSIILQF